MAATFRPCWELDDAPFTGPGTMSAGDVRDLHAGGVLPEVRPTHPSSSSYATNGAHAPPAPTPVPREPENSVIISAEPPPPASGHVAPPSFAPPPPPVAAPAPVPPSARRQAVPALTQPAALVRAAAVDFGEDEFPRKSKKGLFAGVAVVVLAGIGVAVWAGSGSKESTAAPVPTVQKPAEDKVSSIPPPPPETAVAPAPQPPPPPQVTVAAAAAPPPQPAAAPPPVTAPAAPPAAASPPTHAAGGAKTPHEPRPAAPHPKAAGQTIVRDVPF